MHPFKEHESFVADLVKEIPAEAEKLLRPRSRSSRDGERRCWNKAVKKVFEEKSKELWPDAIDFFADWLGKDARGKDKKYHEWLLDAVLYIEEKDVLKGGLVGVESEFGYHVDGIKYDFMKLLSFKAPLKILIVGRSIDAVKNKIEECARGFEQHQPGEVYYLINCHKGRHDVYRYETGRTCPNGRAPAFTFKHLLRLSGDDA